MRKMYRQLGEMEGKCASLAKRVRRGLTAGLVALPLYSSKQRN